MAMALHCQLRSLAPSYCLVKPHIPTLRSKSISIPYRSKKFECMVSNAPETMTSTITRRSGNYKPPIWDYNYIQSLQTRYVGEGCQKRADKLKGEVLAMIDESDPWQQLELVDVLQRLGISYHFECEIDKMLHTIHKNIDHFLKEEENDLHGAALAFRIFRQHHFSIPQEIFNRFIDEGGNFKEWHSKDINGLLSLYEASYFSVEDEYVVDKGREFAIKHLQEYVKNYKHDKDKYNDVEMISHALDLPLHWRMPRLEYRWFIDVYENRHDKNHLLLELAKLDYNMVQAIHQQDLKHTSRWWDSIGVEEKLSFARDRVVENFLWAMGTGCEPQFVCYRRMASKYNSLITVLDDIYDVYGTLDELRLFTQEIKRWDVNSIDHLPEYMRSFFLTLNDFIDEMSLLPLNTQGMNITPYLKNGWVELCEVYMLEAEWYYSGYTPSLEEYMDNAYLTISAPLMLLHAYFLTTTQVTQQALQFLEPNHYHNIIRQSAVILRLADDLGTSSEEIKRGDNPKSIQCIMHEKGVSEEDAREHVRRLIDVEWKKMNKVRVADSPFSRDFIRFAMNYGRVSQCLYEHGDGHASQDELSRSRIQALLFHPIP